MTIDKSVMAEGTLAGEGAVEISPRPGVMTTASQRAGECVVGLTLYNVIAWLIDYPLYAAAVWLLGGFWGGMFMMAVCFPIDLLAVKAYDWSKRDWLAVEYCKWKLTESAAQGRMGRMLKFLRKCPVWLRIVLLSAKLDPFLVTIMIRPGAYRYGGMTAADYRVFLGSFVAGHLWWATLVWGSLASVHTLWESMVHG